MRNDGKPGTLRHINKSGKAGQTQIAIEDLRRRGKPVWDQLPGETAKAYERFCKYRDLGPQRRVRDVAEAFGYHVTAKQGTADAVNVPGVLTRWASDNCWLERARAYDTFLLTASREQMMQDAMDAMVVRWSKRQGDTREEQYALGQLMLDIAKQGMGRAMGIEYTRGPDGNWQETPCEVEKLEAFEKDPAKFVRAAVAVIQSAVYLPQQQRNDGEAAATEGILTLPIDLSDASDEELRTYKATYSEAPPQEKDQP